jgi:murein DD-endopeptidase MepM/ murein hydrolase activator NlpD
MPPKNRLKYRYKFKQRNKRGIPLIRFLLVVTVCVIAGRLLKKNRPASEDVLQSASVFPEIELPAAAGQKLLQKSISKEFTTISHQVRNGESFYSIFNSYAIHGNNLENILACFKKMDLTTIFPGDSIVIEKRDSSFSSVHYYDTRFNTHYKISDNGTVFKASKEKLPTFTHTYVLNGTLETSLSEAMFSMGVSDVITANMTDIFAWDINFFLDPRKGDTFKVVFEKMVCNGKFCGYGRILAAEYTLENTKTFHAFSLCDDSGKLFYYDQDGKAVQKQFLKAPLRYSRISSRFSYRRKHPILGIVRPHLGVDYAAPTGTPVHAAAAGKVQFAGRNGGYGNMIILSHGGVYQTYYGHLHSYARGIRSGKFVEQGQLIGTVGATGLATGPHLDYRMKQGKKFVNPLTLRSPSLKSVKNESRDHFNARKEMYLSLMHKRFGQKKGCYLVDIKPTETGAPQRFMVAVHSDEHEKSE